MAVLKFVDVSKVQAGDALVINNARLTCEYVEQDGIAFDLQLHDSEGNKVRKTICAGERVSIEI